MIVWTWGGVSDSIKKIVSLATVVTVNDDNMVMVLGMLIMVVLVILLMNFLAFRKYVYYYVHFFVCKSQSVRVICKFFIPLVHSYFPKTCDGTLQNFGSWKEYKKQCISINVHILHTYVLSSIIISLLANRNKTHVWWNCWKVYMWVLAKGKYQLLFQ